MLLFQTYYLSIETTCDDRQRDHFSKQLHFCRAGRRAGRRAGCRASYICIGRRVGRRVGV